MRYVLNERRLDLTFFIKKFGDSKIVIRQHAREVVNKLIEIVSPTPILDILLSEQCLPKHGKQMVREEIIHVVMRTLLAFPEINFNFREIVSILATTLMTSESKEKVKYVAMEALALINARIPSKLPEMLQSLDSKSYAIFQQRIQKGQLPILGDDGALELKYNEAAEITKTRYACSFINAF